MDVPVAANVLGTLGAVCWSVQLIPQVIINYRRHDTTGLQPTMMLLWATAGIPLGVYNIVQQFNIALQIQPQILTLLSLITWTQCKYYDNEHAWSWTKCLLAVVPLSIVMGGIETGLVFALRYAVDRGATWPSTFMAILSAVLLCAGVLRHYWDIYTQRTVRGISFMFVGIDALGDLTSFISVFFQKELDVLGMVIYGSELVLWLGVFACGGWFNLRPWIKRWMGRKGEREGDDGGEREVDDRMDEVAGEGYRSPDEVRRSMSSSSSTVFRTASERSHDHQFRLRNVQRA